MQEESNRVSVSISFDDGGTVYGCGHTLDTLLYAHGLQTEESLFEWLADTGWLAINHVLEQYNFNAYTRDRLNELTPSAMLAEMLGTLAPIGVVSAEEIANSEYLPGDWLQINRPEAFRLLVREDHRRILDAVRDHMGDWASAPIPEDLRKELERAQESAQEDATHEWLHGDRSSDGVLRQLGEALFGRHTSAEVEWDQKTDTVTIDASSEEWREWLGYDLGENEPLPSAEKIAEHVKAYTLKKAEDVKQKRARQAEGRQGEYRAREEARKQQEEKEREAARERKRKKMQA